MNDRPSLRPVSLREANDFVEQFHRHNGRTTRDGGKFAIGVELDGELVAVCIVGRPVSATLNDIYTGEVLRVCTRDESPKNCCSMLYAAAWRAWKAMGGKRLVTYTLQTEGGASLRGAGFKVCAECKPGTWNRPAQGRHREWQPIYGQMKFRWEASTDQLP